MTEKHPKDKVLVFSQFADTVDYLAEQLKAAGLQALAASRAIRKTPPDIAYRFSPVSNKKRDRCRRTNCASCSPPTSSAKARTSRTAAIVVNYDLPWAIIRLIQRAGRVDRIGQKSDTILCYSFLPPTASSGSSVCVPGCASACSENAEVVGADEAFFEDQDDAEVVRDLFTEKAGILDGDEDTEVDLASYAYQIWKNAIDRNPELEKIIPAMPNVVYSTRPHKPTAESTGRRAASTCEPPRATTPWPGSTRTATASPNRSLRSLKAAECSPDTPALPRHDDHHEMVAKGVKLIVETEKSVGGQLGRPSGARFRTYERLKAYAEEIKGTLFDTPNCSRPLRTSTSIRCSSPRPTR